MGGSLGPVLANIIMTEFEKVVVENLIKTGIAKFYARYVDDTLLVVDIEICQNGLGIYHKNTQTVQYTNINSFTLRKWKTTWITSLVVRGKRICCNDNLNKEIRLIKNFASWNGFSKNITNSIIKKV